MNIDHESRDRALFQMLINEGYLREEVNAMLASGEHTKLDKLYATLSADTERRKRDVGISTAEGVVSLHELKLRTESQRLDRESEEEQAYFDRVSDQLSDTMEKSGLHEHLLTSATLRALINNLMLQNDAATVDTVKTLISQTLTVMTDLAKRRS
jgi:hypothetical protein